MITLKKVKAVALLSDLEVSMLDLIYPVGTIYKTNNKEFDPNIGFGGTWERYSQGKVIVGVDETDSDFSTSGKTGGNKTNIHSHYTLFSNDGATFYMSASPNCPKSRVLTGVTAAQMSLSNASRTVRQDATYEETINIMQPYITAYIWIRTA